MNAKISVFVICVEAIIYLSLYNLHGCTFKHSILQVFQIVTNLTLRLVQSSIY